MYDWCIGHTRTNIEINDEAVAKVMRRFGLRSKREAVDLALCRLAGEPMTREEALDMHGAHVIEDEAPGEEVR